MSITPRLFHAMCASVALGSALLVACPGESGSVGGVDETFDAAPSERPAVAVAAADADAPADAGQRDAADAAQDLEPVATGDVLSVVRIGGTGGDDDGNTGVAFDPDGNMFVAGTAGGPLSFAGCSITSARNRDVLVARFDATGQCTKALSFGGTWDDKGIVIAVDPTSKDVVVAGVPSEGDFRIAGATVTGTGSSFVAKLSNDLGTVRWATRFGATAPIGPNSPNGLAISKAGKIAIGGTFAKASGVPTTEIKYDRSGASWITTPVGTYIPYLFQLTADGQIDAGSRVFQPKVGSNCVAVSVTSVAYDANGDVYVSLAAVPNDNVAGPCEIYEQLPIAQQTPRYSLTTASVVVARYGTSTLGLWQNVAATVPSAYEGHVAVAPSGRVIVAYEYNNRQSQKLGGLATLVPATQDTDVLLVSYEVDKPAATLEPAAFLLAGSPDHDRPFAIATDRWGNVLVGGVGFGGLKGGGATATGYADGGAFSAGFVLKCRPDLAACPWARMTSGLADERLSRVAVDGKGRVGARGNFRAPGMTFGATKLEPAGELDGFVALLAP